MRMAHLILGFFLVGGLAQSAWAEEPLKLLSPLEKLESSHGPAVVRKTGQTLVVTLPGQDAHGSWFRIEAARGTSLPSGFRTDSAQVHFWMGHLVLLAGGRAWHFSVPGLDRFISQEGQVPGASELAALTRGYDLTEVEVAAIYSANGPRASRLNEGLRSIFENNIDYDDPGSGGIGSCGKTCTTSCGDRSQCSASCGPNRCAQCSCPASCSCS